MTRTFTREETVALAYVIGDWLLRLPPKAAQLGHKRPLNTFRDYVRPVDEDDKIERMAKEFLHDLLAKPSGMSTDEMLLKWYPKVAAQYGLVAEVK